MNFPSKSNLSAQRNIGRNYNVHSLKIQPAMRYLMMHGAKNASKGFSLVEVTMAIGLMSFCLVALVGVLPVGMSQERKSTDQLLALQAMTAVVNDFRSSDLTSTSGSARTRTYGLQVPRNGGTLILDENLKTPEMGWSGKKEYHVSYTVEAPANRFSNYRLSLKVYRTLKEDPTQDASTSYVESVVLKPAL